MTLTPAQLSVLTKAMDWRRAIAPEPPVRQRWYRVCMERLISSCRIEFVGPGVGHGFAVEVIKVSDHPGLELVLGCHANMAQRGSGNLGEEAFHQVQPRAVFGGEDEREAAR